MLSQAIVEFGKPLRAIDVETPVPVGTEVLLKVSKCGVCHSDVHLQDGYFDLGGEKKLAARLALPHTLGHEIVGEVMAAGPETAGVPVGRPYAVFPWIGCESCAACARGEENLCLKPRHLGCVSGVPGGFASHVMVPHSKYLIDYGSVKPDVAAALMCSGITAYAAVKKVGALSGGDRLVVVGCGGVGLTGVAFAKALTGKGPIAADIDAGRLEAALKAGAEAVYNTREEGVAKRFVAETGGAAAVVDFVGSEASFAFANAIVRKGGKIVIVGLFGGALTMPLPMFPMRALTLTGSFVGTLAETKEMMTLVQKGAIVPIPVASRTMDQASAALEDLRAGRVTGRVVLEA